MIRRIAALAAALLATTAQAETPSPKLIVAISVDQFSSDLFNEYRPWFTAGLKRLSQGVVFPAGYQSHAATETCPGHSTILTGSRPARTGIIANDWLDQSIARADKIVYCSEDETVPGSTHRSYTVSDKHLMVPTLGERLKALTPASRNVAVSTKDRATIMMGGHRIDQAWWWNERDYVGPAGQTPDPAMAGVLRSIRERIAKPQLPMVMPPVCEARYRPIPVGTERTVGTGRFERAAGDLRGFRASPESDAAVFDIAATLLDSMRLGRGDAVDVLAVGASATDYVGHAYGTAGSETCLTLMALDRTIGQFLDRLDRLGVDFMVVLTADHGGHDLPERNRIHAATDAIRIDKRLDVKAIGAEITKKLKLKIDGPAIIAQGADIYVARDVPQRRRAAVLKRARAALAASPLVEEVFVGSELAALPQSSRPPEIWSLAERARASYYPGRSGDLIIALKERITPIAEPGVGYVATHGSFWDYDRRVPILFWWKGVAPFEQPLGVETVDILPTLAALVKLPIPAGEIDGKCLDLDAGLGDSCR